MAGDHCLTAPADARDAREVVAGRIDAWLRQRT